MGLPRRARDRLGQRRPLVYEQKVAATYADAAIMAIRAGNDIMMTTPQFYEGAIEAVRSGRLAEAEIDAPVRRLLA